MSSRSCPPKRAVLNSFLWHLNTDPLQPVLAAIEKGEENRAREMLAELIRKEPNNPRYYMWMSTLAETKRERVSNLKEALRLDPNNATVRQGVGTDG